MPSSPSSSAVSGSRRAAALRPTSSSRWRRRAPRSAASPSTTRGRSRSLIAALFVALALAYAQFPADYSVREHLPQDDPANAALGRIDQHFDGAFPVQIVVPMQGDIADLAGGPRKNQGRARGGRQDPGRRIAALAVEPRHLARRGGGRGDIGTPDRRPRRSFPRPRAPASSGRTARRRWSRRASRKPRPMSRCR